MKRLAVLLATAGGAGYSPVASGTAGSAVGVVLYLLTRTWPAAWQVGLAVIVTIVGIWAGHLAAQHFGREDPGEVVIDEVAGQLITLLFTGVRWPGAILGFFIFRVLDVIKPWPADRFERLHGGLGIMMDDVMAAVYGNILMQVAIRLMPRVL
jgi:phosphatidylglycerophosphatase A